MFILTDFLIELKKDNPTYERVTKSDLHNLVEYLKKTPVPVPAHVWAEMNKVAAQKWVKYARTHAYLFKVFPKPVLLDVPFISQLNIGAPKGGHGIDDPTGCWYASACMIGYYFEVGPRFGLPELYKLTNAGGKAGQMGHFATGSDDANQLLPEHHRILAKREHFEPVENCETAHDYSYAELANLLSTRGPIFMYWKKTHGGHTYGHASVIIGVTPGMIMYHDPENAPGSSMPIAKFNTVRQKWEFALMQRKK